MCDCIEKLVDKGFVERQTIYENFDYKDKGFLLREYKLGNTQKVAFPTKHVFQMNYCPACGGKLQ